MKPPFYRCAACRHDFTVTAGTLFADPTIAKDIGGMIWWPGSIPIEAHDRRTAKRACRLRSLSALTTAPARLARLIAA
jgi:hypothetical protein